MIIRFILLMLHLFLPSNFDKKHDKFLELLVFGTSLINPFFVFFDRLKTFFVQSFVVDLLDSFEACVQRNRWIECRVAVIDCPMLIVHDLHFESFGCTSSGHYLTRNICKIKNLRLVQFNNIVALLL